MFHSVTQDKISIDIIRQIRQAVLSGQLKPGHRLPPERELLTQFGVSKHTLREAMRALEVMGFLVIRKGAGGGAEVVEVDERTAQDSMVNFLYFRNVSVGDLTEVRAVLEPYLARDAAARLSAGQIAELRAMNEECRQCVARGEDIVGALAEVEFHRMLAKANGNPVLSLILDFVNRLLTDTKRQLKPGLEFSRKVLAAHERILDALEARDGERAADEMLVHVMEVQEGLKTVLSMDGAN